VRSVLIFISILFATLMLSPTHALAKDEVYRWVDENGVVHFGDMPDGQTNPEQLDIRATPNNGIGTNPAPVSADPGPQAQAQPSIAQQRRDERAEKRREAALEQEAIARNCELAHQRVVSLEPSPRVLVENEDGSVSRLDDDKRLELLAEAKAYIAENCEK